MRRPAPCVASASQTIVPVYVPTSSPNVAALLSSRIPCTNTPGAVRHHICHGLAVALSSRDHDVATLAQATIIPRPCEAP